MRYFLLFFVSIFSIIHVIGQNVGINNADPQVSLDINGALAHRSVIIDPFMNNVNIPVDASYVIISNVDVTGPITIFAPEYIDGKRLVIQNISTQIATFGAYQILQNEIKEFIGRDPGGYISLSTATTPSWNLSGNASTNSSTHFIGTTDNNDLVFKTNNTEKIRLLTPEANTILQLKSTLEDTSNTLLFVNRNELNEGIDFAISRKSSNDAEFGLNFSSMSNFPLFRHNNLLYLSAFSGNVGIGLRDPFGKLTIGGHRSLGSNFPTLMLIDSSLTNENGSSLQFRNYIGANNYQITSHLGNHPEGFDSYLTFSRNSFYHMRLRGDGNLGLGIINPTSKLDVNGDVAISGNNRLELGKNIEDKEANAGTIGYQRFSDALDIVGAGSNADLTDRKVKIWAEGGTTINGNMTTNGDAQLDGNVNVNGVLKIDNNAGTAGQILTSNGPSSSPTWQSPPMPNNVRFDFRAQNSSGPASGGFNWDFTSFNTNPSAVYLADGMIHFAETGLYRLEVEVSANLLVDNGYNGVPPRISIGCYFNGVIGTGAFGNHIVGSELIYPSYPAITTYRRTMPFKGDYYITAGTSLSYSYFYTNSPSPIMSYYTDITCRGYKID